ncbi:CxC2 domain-containing protein [Mycena indigotica]|uniref:CxC2 domain-containing protein n=1 Tax=Mycena indigotica TaxID=2126181 RepID=A0A8H6SQ36_9AGAR|nr:CxC2 domain-containing protein [Mycena indigotica]KAF7303364.1 CxC2 domain-containing protein [Mycena indigotica]
MPPIQFRASRAVFDSDSDEEMAAAPRMGSFRHNISIATGGQLKTRTEKVPAMVSPQKRQPRIHEPLQPDELTSRSIFAALEAGENPWMNEGFEFDEGHPIEKRLMRPSERPLAVWAQTDVDSYLDEIMILEGIPPAHVCFRCGKEAILRCRDCFIPLNAVCCTDCMLHQHRNLPFHRPERWGGSFFEPITLKSLGLRVQLGHASGVKCPGTLARLAAGADISATDDDFFIVDCNGIHTISVDFCTCPSARERTIQLLQARLFPATSTRPRTAATFQVLRLFHLISFEAKSSAYEFYNGLARLTNNNGIFVPRDRYREFLHMTREWRYLQMLKRAGRGHEPNGTQNIPAGACALLCPACPQPGMNLPNDDSWRNGPVNKRFRYSLFLAIDANFKMKRKQVLTEEADPGLNQGSAVLSKRKVLVSRMTRSMSPTASRAARLHQGSWAICKKENVISTWTTCSGRALRRSTYANLVDIIVSYDIVCQWSKNIWFRLAKYKSELQDAARGSRRRYVFLIPKFHLPAHIERCNIDYSFDLTPNVGRTDGEAPERGWANVNPLAASTKEMGPGSRRDTIDDHFNDWNHKKILGMGKSLLEKMKDAVTEMVETRIELAELEAVLPVEVIETWEEVMKKWEEDSSQPNPFSITSKVESLQDIRARLKDPSSPTFVPLPPDFAPDDDIHNDLHAADLIAMGLTLEEQRQALANDAANLGAHATALQRSSIAEREVKLQRKFVSWFDTQREFAPEITALRSAEEARQANSGQVQPTRGSPLYRLALLLPSEAVGWPQCRMRSSHAWYEFHLRHGRALHLLEELRRLLLLRTQKYKAKDKHASGVAGHTRAAKGIQAVDERIRRVADEYRRMRLAMGNLKDIVGDDKWMRVLKDLKPADVRAMPRALFSDPDRRKRRREDDEAPKEMSWIWRMGIGSLPTELAIDSLSATAALSEEAAIAATNESLRVEWAKARARAKRWAEEVELLEEEMRRVLEFCSWKAAWWMDLSNRRQGATESLMAGLRAYAERQAHIHSARQLQFAANWRDVPTFSDLGLQQVDEIHRASAEPRGPLSLTVDDHAAFLPVPDRIVLGTND